MSNEIGTKKLSFNIQGEFITKLHGNGFIAERKAMTKFLRCL